ncbi:PREDICTED: phospholipid scramblase 1-like isoform X2 [Dinoponera quadriceps]|uniref:Phospholipid scramblase n=1 Tax=Dinoponera quadriceps TaxID=609295 RepID=A0A6P3X097_DINQU|nr:PREDICTED: phospholipid scramblase 1-like isoform X2 [Dinoponera quadriceps]
MERNHPIEVHDTTDAVTQTMELQDNAPVFYSSATIITMQPGASDSRSPRRPIPVNTMDWISTPRSQLNAITGTQFLAGVEQLEIQQVIDLSTLLGRVDRGHQYRVKVPRAESLFLAMEKKDETKSRLFGWYKGFVLNVLDQCGETAFVIRKDPSWMHMPGSRQRITVESANLIGSVEENFSVIGPHFTVYDASKTPLCKIHGPNICGCCMYKEALFQVVSMDGSRQLASLMHQWDHLSVDYVLLLTFPIDTDVKVKSLLLGASFLIVSTSSYLPICWRPYFSITSVFLFFVLRIASNSRFVSGIFVLSTD